MVKNLFDKKAKFVVFDVGHKAFWDFAHSLNTQGLLFIFIFHLVESSHQWVSFEFLVSLCLPFH
jgi:hypothetical protein